MNPQRLLQQLQAAMKDSPMQQALLMHMLQESLAAPSQAQAPKRQVVPIHLLSLPFLTRFLICVVHVSASLACSS